MCVGKVYFRLGSRGKEHIPASGGVLIAANHASFLDPPLIGSASPRRFRFLARSSLFKIPLLGLWMKHVGVIPIRRGGVDRKALRQCIDLVKKGEAVMVFPEGTRTHDGELQNSRGGVGLIAKALSTFPIVPVYIDGSYRALSRGGVFPKPVKVRVVFGEPFTIDKYSQNDDKGNPHLIAETIMHEIKKVKERAVMES